MFLQVALMGLCVQCMQTLTNSTKIKAAKDTLTTFTSWRMRLIVHFN